MGKTLPADRIGESWELYDFPPGVIEGESGWVSSVVAEGPLAGRTLHELVEDFGVSLMGDVPTLRPHGQFPLLVKFLDAQEDLSVQVHPDEAYASAHPEAHLKSEAWYVVQADPDARILKGVKPGVTPPSLREAVAQNRVVEQLVSIPARAGHCFYLPSGTVHALGAGMLVAEVQTPSDTTFRLYDFNRIDPSTGKPRKLHVEEAMECIDFSGKEVRQSRSHVGGFFTTVSRLVSSPYFKLEKVRFIEGIEEPVPYDEPVVWIMLEGSAEVRVKGMREPARFTRGDTVLLPAQMNQPIIKTLTDCVWLEVTFPTRPEPS